MAEALKRPGGELASRPLHFFWVVDCSGSMYGEKIGTVNHAIQSTIPEMVDAAKDMLFYRSFLKITSESIS